jgi:hypothetical protein
MWWEHIRNPETESSRKSSARTSIDRSCAVMHYFKGQPGMRNLSHHRENCGLRLQALDGYLTSQSDWLVN